MIGRCAFRTRSPSGAGYVCMYNTITGNISYPQSKDRRRLVLWPNRAPPSSQSSTHHINQQPS